MTSMAIEIQPSPADLIGKIVMVEKKGSVFFYEVVRATDTQVVLLENQHKVESIGHLSLNVTPKRGVFMRQREYRKKILPHAERDWCVKMPEGLATVWDGKPKNTKN